MDKIEHRQILGRSLQRLIVLSGIGSSYVERERR